MKQGSNPLSGLAEAALRGQQRPQLPEGRPGFSSQAGAALAPLPRVSGAGEAAAAASVGAAMPEQLLQHLASARAAAWAGTDIVEPYVRGLGHESVQVLLLRERTQFTQLVDSARASDFLGDVEALLRQCRSDVICRLRQPLTERDRRALNALQALLQEQQHTAAGLAAASRADSAAAWAGEMRFYQRPDGALECHCGGRVLPVRAENMDPSHDTVLVSTDVTREVRRAFFEAFSPGGPGLLLVEGQAGTGKTETCKDICDMLGRSCTVVSAGETPPEDAAEWRLLIEQGDVLIIDEANRLPSAAVEEALRAARDAGIPLVMTSNPLFQDCQFQPSDVFRGRSVLVETRVPDLPLIVSSLLACEGLQDADELADRTCGLFSSLAEKCTRQRYYDFGLRKFKAVAREAGKASRAAHYMPSERLAVTAAVMSACAPSMLPVDETVLARSLVDHFGAEATVPVLEPVRDFWSAAATKLSRTTSSRHASLCLPVPKTEEAFVRAVVEEAAAKVGAVVVAMPGDMATASEEELFGSFVGGVWRDGSFTRALREAVSDEHPKWLLVFCGASDLGNRWERLNSLTDDNKVLRLGNGEHLALRPESRIVFAAPGLDATPAVVSRLGVVNLDSQRRNRL